MCGIFGAINSDSKSKFLHSLSLLRHRGPDNQEIYEDKNIFLGHTRLSIIDLDSRSNQPMSIDDLVITFNGEIYNYLEIKKVLLEKGYSFYTNSDTEVILKSYQEWGEDCVKQFNGMWAFCILNTKSNQLFLSRDRFGVKPLYYIHKENIFVFSSEIKALLPYLATIKANKTELIKYLIYGVQEHQKETMFYDVYRFPTAHNAQYDLNNNTLSFSRYFTLEIKEKNSNILKIKSQLNTLLDKSINLRLRSDVKIGMALSGGVDSNIIVSKAHSINTDIESFSSIYTANNQINENANIDMTVKKLTLTQHYVISDIDNLLKNIEEIVWIQDEPFDTLSIFAQYQVYNEMHTHGAKVSLDGQGADEIFGGYPTYRSVVLRENLLNISFLYDYLKYDRNSLLQDTKLILGSFFPKLFEKLYFNKRAKKIFTCNVSFISSAKRSFLNFKNLNERLLSDVQEYLSVLLRYVDRNSMAKSVESRAPFLDFNLIQFAFTLPSRIKYKKGFSKYLLRKTFEDDVTECIIWNKDKKGFPVPQDEWCQDEGFIHFANHYLENSKILKALHINKNIDKKDPMYWKIINIAIWEKKFNIGDIK